MSRPSHTFTKTPRIVSGLLAFAALAGLGISTVNAADYGDRQRLGNRGAADVRVTPEPRRAETDDYSYEDYDETRRQDRHGRWNGQRDGQWNGETRRHDGHGPWRPGYRLQRVEAVSSYASDYLPHHVKRWRAERSAIEAWSMKVERLYGPEFAKWRSAEGQNVSCDGGAGSVYCTASARPVRGWSRWGSWRNRAAY
ncbi:MAG: hypothetical protein ACRCS9_10685 [Hyphomicrobium sp.]